MDLRYAKYRGALDWYGSTITHSQQMVLRDRDIRRMRQAGLTLSAIAQEFGLSKQRVGQILGSR